MKSTEQILEVWGELACFTRPEFKVERFSYPVITPSAARGIFDAIYCKPSKDGYQAEFRWQVTRVEILKPIKYIALRRNEVKEKIAVHSVTDWMAGNMKPEPIWADGTRDDIGSDQKGRTQRQTMALKDVRYRLSARIIPWKGFEDRLTAQEAQFRRRASQGKCLYQPYFGCREFPTYFELVDNISALTKPEHIEMDIGLMLYDVFNLSRPGTSSDSPSISLFNAKITGGVMEIPDYGSPEVLRG